MAENNDLANELAALRADIEALRAARDNDVGKVSGDQPSAISANQGKPSVPFAVPLPEQFQEFQAAIQELSEAVESEIAERPVVAVGAAFLLGIMIGRLSAN